MTSQNTPVAAIVALVSLASGIAANHPAMCACQLNRLRGYGVNEDMIETVIDIARHIREEAAEKVDMAFDDAIAAQNTELAEMAELATSAA
jgi:hypothetical protein